MKTRLSKTRTRDTVPTSGGLYPRPAPGRVRSRPARIREILHRPRPQAKLTVGPPDDVYEREADRVADQVMRMPAPGDGVRRWAPGPRRGSLQRTCAECRKESVQRMCAECEEERVQRTCTECEDEMHRQPLEEVEEALESRIRSLRGGGRALPESARAFFEPRFGHDFGDVRVHSDPASAQLARSVDARAFTVGRDVVFGPGEFTPGTPEGRRLLAHELTHVVQQGAVGGAEKRVQRRVREENVSCRNTGLRNPDLTGPEVVEAIRAADAEAITLARRAELLLDFHLLFTRAGDPIDAEFDTILQEELGLSLANAAHHPLIEQQRDRFRRVRETLESGYLRYMCRGGTVKLVGCQEGPCGDDFAFTCPGNRLVVLCQAFWDTPDERAATILHEPFHIWFDMARHAPNALRRADASCFESFALRVAGEDAPASCAGHTNG